MHLKKELSIFKKELSILKKEFASSKEIIIYRYKFPIHSPFIFFSDIAQSVVTEKYSEIFITSYFFNICDSYRYCDKSFKIKTFNNFKTLSLYKF